MGRKTKSSTAMAARLFRSRRKDLERFLATRIAKTSEAEDLAQEAFLRLLRLDDTDFIRRPEQYLVRIAANLAWEHRLKQKNSLIDLVPDIAENADSREAEFETEYKVAVGQQIELLERVLEKLPPNVGRALIMHRRDGKTYREIADHLGVSTNMVKKYLRTGVAACRMAVKRCKDEH